MVRVIRVIRVSLAHHRGAQKAPLKAKGCFVVTPCPYPLRVICVSPVTISEGFF